MPWQALLCCILATAAAAEDDEHGSVTELRRMLIEQQQQIDLLKAQLDPLKQTVAMQSAAITSLKLLAENSCGASPMGTQRRQLQASASRESAKLQLVPTDGQASDLTASASGELTLTAPLEIALAASRVRASGEVNVTGRLSADSLITGSATVTSQVNVGYLHVNAQNGANEGGEIRFAASPSQGSDWTADVYSNRFRLHTAGVEKFSVGASTMKLGQSGQPSVIQMAGLYEVIERDTTGVHTGSTFSIDVRGLHSYVEITVFQTHCGGGCHTAYQHRVFNFNSCAQFNTSSLRAPPC